MASFSAWPRRLVRLVLWLLFASLYLGTGEAFAPCPSLVHCRIRQHTSPPTRSKARGVTTTTTTMMMLPPATTTSPFVETTSSSLILAGESWRQYVPLVVSLLVITDILLGSPAANAVLSIARPKEEQDGDAAPPNDDNATAGLPSLTSLLSGTNPAATPTAVRDSKERVDTMAVAQAALDKAAATQDLRKFLDESKSDMDKMRDVQKKLDEQLAAYDQKQMEKEQEQKEE